MTTRLLLVVLLGAAAAPAYGERPESPSDGQVHQSAEEVIVWDARADRWVSPEAFWLGYARTTPGRYWGRSSEYPPYGEVREHDTLLIDAEGGPCLMYFFHTRWRRAQDVRRWDPAFNELAGCPHVFD